MQILSLEIPTPFSIGSVNSYLILDEDITLVDTGPKTEVAWKSLVYQLNEKGIRIQDISRIILTHYHIDHSGLVSVIREHHPDIEVYAHSLAIEPLKKDSNFNKHSKSFFYNLYTKNGLSNKEILAIEHFYDYLDTFSPPIQTVSSINEGDKIEGLNDWEIIHVPGHSLSDIVLYNPKTKWLISGDNIIGKISPGIFMEAPIGEEEPYCKSLELYQQSLIKLSKLDIDQVFPGHGQVFTDVNLVIDQQLEKIKYREQKIVTILTNNRMTVYEIMIKLFPKRYFLHMALFFSETLGSLDIMEKNGVVTKIIENNLIKYFLN